MAIIYIEEAVSLLSNDEFASICPETKKPELSDSGFLSALKPKKENSPTESRSRNETCTPILDDSPNLRNIGDSFMSNLGYIQLKRSEETFWLLQHQPISYLLLNLIALRAQRKSNHPSGLEIGEALIGDYAAIGVTRQQYRTALSNLVLMNHIKIIETCRTRKKSTTGTTTVGTKVKLLSSTIWDINLDDVNHRINHCPTTDQPPTNHEQEVKKIKREEEYKSSSSEPPFSPSPLATSLLTDFYSSLFQSNPDFPKDRAKRTKFQYQAAERLLKQHDIETLMSVITYAHKQGGFWIAHVNSMTYLEKKFHTLLTQMKSGGKKPYEQKKKSHHNEVFDKDERPVQFENSISFRSPT